MIGVPFVMEAQAGEYGASRQIEFDVHQRMAVTADRALLLARLKPRRADPPEDQRSAAHRPDESENLSSLTREPVPQLRPRPILLWIVGVPEWDLDDLFSKLGVSRASVEIAAFHKAFVIFRKDL